MPESGTGRRRQFLCATVWNGTESPCFATRHRSKPCEVPQTGELEDIHLVTHTACSRGQSDRIEQQFRLQTVPHRHTPPRIMNSAEPRSGASRSIEALPSRGERERACSADRDQAQFPPLLCSGSTGDQPFLLLIWVRPHRKSGTGGSNSLHLHPDSDGSPAFLYPVIDSTDPFPSQRCLLPVATIRRARKGDRDERT